MEDIKELSGCFNYTYYNAYQNMSKNRYTDVLACDSTLVSGPYINANWVLQNVIATQAPLTHTISDFWNMAYNNDINKIVMLTNIEEGKCSCYWDDRDVLKETHKDYYVIREIKCKDKTIIHYQYLDWEDKGVPSVNNFIQFMNEFSRDDKIVVHCSAGVGRTGVFCTIYNFLYLNENSGDLKSILVDIILGLRKNREGMVQNTKQFDFCLEVAKMI